MNRSQKLFILSLLVFFLVNLLQAIFVPVSEDEAYYWMYSRTLDWGYFDHPPMVALFVKLGSLFFNGVFGLRILTTIISGFTLFIIWKVIPQNLRDKEYSVLVFLLLAFASPLLNIYGFITTPDVPLLFFSALYLYTFIKFTEHQTWRSSLTLGFVAALLMYSKYHGAFLIIIALIPYYRLLWNRYFILAGITGIILYLPHLFWQYQNDFISFRYHMYGRTDGFMNGKHIFDYLLNILLIFNPLLFGMFIYNCKKSKQKTVLSPVLPFVFWGFILLFGLISLRDHIEPQWIGIGVIPFIVMLFSGIMNSEKLRKIIKPIAYFSILAILIIRIGILSPFKLVPDFYKKAESYHSVINEKADGANVVFINSYIDAAKYTFYTGAPAYSFNCYTYRKNQYDIWNYEDSYHNQEVLLVTSYHYPWADSMIIDDENTLFYKRFKHFPMVNKLKARKVVIKDVLERGQEQTVSLNLKSPYEYDIHVNDKVSPLKFYLMFLKDKHKYFVILDIDNLTQINAKSEIGLKGSFILELEPDEYEVVVCIQSGELSPVLISEKFDVEIR